MCFRATAGALVSQVFLRPRATASARALDRARVRVSVYAFVRDWVRVRVGIRLEG